MGVDDFIIVNLVVGKITYEMHTCDVYYDFELIYNQTNLM